MWTEGTTSAWRAAAPPGWWRIPLVVLGVAGAIVSGFGPVDQDVRAVTSLLEVEVFGPYAGLLIASFVGVWLAPRTGLTAGIVAALIELRYDPTPLAHWFFAAYAAACAVLLAHQSWSIARQRRIAREAGDAGENLPHAWAAPGTVGRDTGWSVPNGLVVVRHFGILATLAVTALALLAWSHGMTTDAEHRARSVVVEAVALDEYDGDFGQYLELVDRTAAPSVPAKVVVEPTEFLAPGTRLPVRVDPAEPTWSELPFDPHDNSGWTALATLTGMAALWLARTEWRRVRAVRARSTRIGVECRAMSEGMVALRPVGGGTAFGEFETLSDVVLRRGRSRNWMPAGLVGDVRIGGWVSLDLAGARIEPVGPLRGIPEGTPPDLP